MIYKIAAFTISLAYPLELMPDSDSVGAAIEGALWLAGEKVGIDYDFGMAKYRQWLQVGQCVANSVSSRSRVALGRSWVGA